MARNPEQLKANREVQSKAIRILASLNERKIPEKDVIAGDIRSEPEYEDNGAKRGKVVGFIITRQFTIQLRDLPALPKLVDDLVSIGGVEFSGITGGLSNEKEVRNELAQKALANAREEGEKTVKEIGMKIESVFAVSPVPFLAIQQKMFGGPEERPTVTGSYIGNTPQYRLAPLEITQSVNIIYLISPIAK